MPVVWCWKLWKIFGIGERERWRTAGFWAVGRNKVPCLSPAQSQCIGSSCLMWLALLLALASPAMRMKEDRLGRGGRKAKTSLGQQEEHLIVRDTCESVWGSWLNTQWETWSALSSPLWCWEQGRMVHMALLQKWKKLWCIKFPRRQALFGLVPHSLGWPSWQALQSFHSKAQRGFSSSLAWDPRHSGELQGELAAESRWLQCRGFLQRQVNGWTVEKKRNGRHLFLWSFSLS